MTQEQASEQLIQQTVIEKLFTDLFKRLSVCLLILGRRGSGKTDIALLIAEILYKFKIIQEFATNIKIHKSYFPIKHVDNLEDLEVWASETSGKKLFILDEAGKTLRRRTPMSRLNVQWLDDLQILRKYRLSIIMVVPAEKYIDSAALGSDILDAVILKSNFKNPKIAYYEDKMEETATRLWDIPGTSIDFDTWDIAVFKKSSANIKAKFPNKQLQDLWHWSHGTSHKELELHPMQINRLSRRFIRVVLEAIVHGSQKIEIEDIFGKDTSLKIA